MLDVKYVERKVAFAINSYRELYVNFFLFTFVRKKCLKDTHVNKRSEAVIP